MKRLTKEEFIKKAIKIHGNKYGYDKVEYVKRILKVLIWCKECQEYFEQTPNNHLIGYQCGKCSRRKVANLQRCTKEEFIKKATKVHGTKYNYDKTNYVGSHTKVFIMCKKCGGVFSKGPNKHLLGQGCPKCAIKKRVDTRRMTKKCFVEKAKKIHGDKYGYDKVININSKIKILIWCKKCEKYFEQPFNIHLRGRGCWDCGVKQSTESRICTTEKFILKAIKVHGNIYDYSLTNYVNSKDKIIIICKKHGEFEQSPSNHLHGCGCLRCRASLGEKKIEKILIKQGINYKKQKTFFGCKNERQLLFDFYLLKLNTLIEYDGEFHYGDIRFKNSVKLVKDTQFRDAIKTKYAKDNNIKLIRIPYWDFNNIETILKKELKLNGERDKEKAQSSSNSMEKNKAWQKDDSKSYKKISAK